jgi:hypothetical protein
MTFRSGSTAWFGGKRYTLIERQWERDIPMWLAVETDNPRATMRLLVEADLLAEHADLTAVLAAHDDLAKRVEEKTARRCAQICDNYIGPGVAGATIRREFKL